ncbi:Dehydrogenase [Lachnellula occidentalis]|uniref:Short-chain dehydrogenase/reductase 3 n=1 Tax=Lachnellula occidentalis TaxID=215460 RepID=A0A8H8UJ65_9HELO|nr:Dehydrogenase [Lachnellula occidentalis]
MAPRKVSPLAVLTAPIRLALFDPRVTCPLLVALLYYPDKLRSILPAQLHQYVTSSTFIRILKACLALKVVTGVSSKLSDMALNNWTGKTTFLKSQEIVLITGGASGIGELMAKEFAANGVKVVVLDLNPPKVPFPAGIHFYEADVTSSAQIASAAAEIRKAHGNGPTILINNAGIGGGRTILTEPEQAIRKTFEVNIIAHFLTVKEFLPEMIERNHGHVVTIASMSSFVVPAQLVDYACTKAALIAFNEGLASELRSRYKAPKVKTTQKADEPNRIVHPSWIRTPLIEPLTSHPDFKDGVLEPEEVSGAIVKQVLSGKSAQMILPGHLARLRGVRGWPTWLQSIVWKSQEGTLDLFEELRSI